MDQDDGFMYLPPGFRFHPMDEEIITHYLWQKVANTGFTATAIGEIDLNKCEPWDLPSKAKMGEKEWYFFCHRDRKYPTGTRTNRATEAGYWKATGKDKEICHGNGKGNLVGMKKTLVFYMGRAPNGEKTNWVMHEYRLEGRSSYHNLPRPAKEEWVVCRILHKNTEAKKVSDHEMMMVRTNSFSMNTYLVDELLESPTLPPLMDTTWNNAPSTSSQPMKQKQEQEGIFQTQLLPHLEKGSTGCYLHQQRCRCKEEEQQSTAISNDKNTETSSLGKEFNCSHYYDDLDNLWKS